MDESLRLYYFRIEGAPALPQQQAAMAAPLPWCSRWARCCQCRHRCPSWHGCQARQPRKWRGLFSSTRLLLHSRRRPQRCRCQGWELRCMKPQQQEAPVPAALVLKVLAARAACQAWRLSSLMRMPQQTSTSSWQRWARARWFRCRVLPGMLFHKADAISFQRWAASPAVPLVSECH